MTRLPDRFTEDRRLRDAARAVLTEDVERLRASLSQQGIASRVSAGVTTTVSSRIRAGARDVLAGVQAQAGDHKGLISGLVAAVILWFARGPIMEWFEQLLSEVGDIDDIDDNESGADTPVSAPEGDPA